MASAKASVMGVRLQILLVITSPPVGETVSFSEKARHKSLLKDSHETFCGFLYSRQPVSGQPARSLIKEGMSATVGFKDLVFLHETRSRVNKHLRKFNDFSTICGKRGTLVNLYFQTP
jgi:hypothetical protein